MKQAESNELKIKEAYENGMSEAWELARMILHGFWDQTAEIFDLDIYEMTPQSKVEIIDIYTPQEVKEKIEAWKKSKEIKAGDVVETDDCSGVVLDWCSEDKFHVFTENRCVETWCVGDVVKTNTSVDLQGLISSLGGEK